jgi:hypothetical protein
MVIILSNILERILSLVVAQDSQNCMILCKRTDFKIVDIIKVTKHAKGAPLKSIHYNNDTSETLRGRLSKDMTCCYINNEVDNVFFDS